MKNTKYIYTFIVFAVLTVLAGALPVLADNTIVNQSNNGIGSMMRNRGDNVGKGNWGMMKGGVFGTVSAINGNTIAVVSKQFIKTDSTNTTSTTVTYTVDATNAKIMKNNVAGTITSILVGDNVSIQGTVTGTNVVAINIRDGFLGRGVNGDVKKMENKDAQNNPLFAGNGQPIVAGTVSLINGVTLTITNKSNVTYTIDTTNAKIMKGSNTILISNVVVGDNIIAQGTVNGNAVVASTVIDQAQPITTGTNKQPSRGFFGGIGSFFAHLFGY